MPNWCFNRLEITGERKIIQEFKEKAKAKETMLSLDNLYPMPDELKDGKISTKEANKALLKKYGYDNWYDWCIRNWGTKWDVEATIDRRVGTQKGRRVGVWF